ncbi:hypothetical protein BDK92_6047 [Micromonospora pisi]|uniref:Uncharacterized protein n=1 Tax=Micromonospora pisi TaxID=589240 RepID=A0A495JSR2_9ACTN|nr:hypothetical protein [Micromonospora pisi]RKR91645.1 hypothetical protein BDK92_6047 [Micromonospora pisi]
MALDNGIGSRMKALRGLIRIVRALFLASLALDSVLVGWLLFSAESPPEFAVGLLISVLIPGGLYGLWRLLERLATDPTDVGRHAR